MLTVAESVKSPLLADPPSVAGQSRGNPDGEWRYWGADAWSTRYAPLDQINGSNLGDPELADGLLFTVAGATHPAALAAFFLP